ncbi:MAG: DUF721 domain-containing protein [Gemmobacter sp.]
MARGRQHGDDAPPPRRMRGFEPAAGLVARRVQSAGESRGFAVARLLTRWDEVAGAELAACTRPVRIGYGRDGFGATLTLLVTGAHAPMVEMRKEDLRARVNACYGYNAVSRILLTQTAAQGFAEPPARFAAAPPAPAPEARAAVEGVSDPQFRAALEALAQNVFTRAGRKRKEQA